VPPLILSVEAFCEAGAGAVWVARVTGVFTRRKSQGVTRSGIRSGSGIEPAADRTFMSFFGFGGTGGGNGNGSSKRQGRTASTRSKEPALGVE
jgi:hypothetical protein